MPPKKTHVPGSGVPMSSGFQQLLLKYGWITVELPLTTCMSPAAWAAPAAKDRVAQSAMARRLALGMLGSFGWLAAGGGRWGRQAGAGGPTEASWSDGTDT